MKFLNKKILPLIIIIFVLILSMNKGLNSNMVFADTTLKTGISLVEHVPSGLFGTWRVAAVLKTTDSPEVFAKKSADLWNLSRDESVMNLTNPFTGASADLSVEFVKDNVIRFTKQGVSDDKRLTDTVELKLNGNKFTGINRLSLQTLSPTGGAVIKIQSAEYVLVGEKISGMSVLEK